MTGATHLCALALALLSLLFGGGLCVLREALRGCLAALRLLPPPIRYRSPFPALLGQAHRKKKEESEKEARSESRKEDPGKNEKGTRSESRKEDPGKSEKEVRSESRKKDPGKNEKEKGKEKRHRLPPFAVGTFFFDLFFLLSFAVLYLIFLFVVNEGVVRAYSLLCVFLGFFLLRRAAHRVLAVPLFRLGSFLFSLLAFLGSFLIFPVFVGIRRLSFEKKAKKNLTKSKKRSIIKGIKRHKEQT
ncbi:MAG: spore cortex biosynthesis protein YabQ [Clostridia bacterium]|nr:spore cortex biosynthesis protein YabQ [Clostridia bacterium]